MSFTAKYHGSCGECAVHISPGDTAGYQDDVLVCEDCLTGPAVLRPNRRLDICPRCHLTRPCDCPKET